MSKFGVGRVVPEDIPRLAGYMTSAETAILLNVTPGRVSQMLRAGKFGQPFRIGPHIVLQAEGVRQEYIRRLNHKKYRDRLGDRIFPREYLPIEPPDIDESLKEAAAAYINH